MLLPAGSPVASFHERMQQRAAKLPHGLTATATHDTKRGEDARTRLIALSELADEWTQQRARMAHAQREVHQFVRRSASPPRRTNTCSTRRCSALGLSAAWTQISSSGCRLMPSSQRGKARSRRVGWRLTKPMRAASRSFLVVVLDRRHSARFIDSFDAFARRAALIGALKSLTQLVTEGDDARRSRFLPGHRILGSVAGGPGQQAPRRLSSSGVSPESRRR